MCECSNLSDKDVDIMGVFRIKKKITTRPSAIESPSKVILSDSEKNSKFLKWNELQSVEIANPDTLRHERRCVCGVTCRTLGKSSLSHHTHTASRVSECRILQLQRSVTRANLEILNFNLSYFS